MDPRKEKRRDDPRNNSNVIPYFSTKHVDHDEIHGFGESNHSGGRKDIEIT